MLGRGHHQMLAEVKPSIRSDADYQSVLKGIESGMKEVLLSGLAGSSRPLVLAAMKEDLNQPMLVVTHNLFAAQKLVEDMQECMSADEVLLYPANELWILENAYASPELVAQRIQVLSRLEEGFRGILVTPYSGLRKIIPTVEMMKEAKLSLKVGQAIAMEKLLEHLVYLGYSRVEKVETRGEFSVRGGIVDIYPLISVLGYRIEFFDEEVDSIRLFDPTDQRSHDKRNDVVILPCKELVATKDRSIKAAAHARGMLEAQLEKMTDRMIKDKLQSELGHDIEKLSQGEHFQEIFKYVSLLYPDRHTLIDYMPKNTVLVLDEPVRLIETSKQQEKDEAEGMTNLIQEGKSIPALVMSKPYESLLHRKPFQTIYVSLFLRQVPNTHPQHVVNFTCRSMQNFHGQMNVLKSEADRWKKSGQHVICMAANEDRVKHVERVLSDFQIEGILVREGNLQAGFELPSSKLVVITESEMFTQKQRKVRKSETTMTNAERIKSYTDLRVGDFVVHINHGIGKYVGIGTLVIQGVHKDYIHIVYSGGDKLSVPIEQIDQIQKYIGSEEKEPRVHKLGGTEWTKAKTKARASVRDIADELIKLYAERQAIKGFAFNRDSTYQKEFEALFPYDETRDQLRAIEEIKRDMEKTRPMDRLLCGDVGYGKTEVAIRAAFKSAIEGKQVAVLVPTTILAQQHFETFKERFSGYPIRIEVISRFRSKKEQNDAIKGVKNGTVDVIIGTHRLLSQDMVFKDLGLLIVDEEQRFGVSHKEKLKKFRTNVDVLTLTATPIPRTLHMSMIGVRDLSVIETPPENRFPVQTYVVEHSMTLVRESIERELSRNGQVYYLYNRVQGISQIAEQLNQLVPDAKVAVVHGQMNEQELEKTILEFLDGESDVLVATSIIETGVDIPNVNTLIVHDADKMGLSQLYQLRGRVGRSNRIAYAYFTYQRDKVLTEVAEKRLQAIKEFTELGSGFKIAMRDLSIRGAGNLLGAEQHGFIASVGFDLYSQMLAEEIQRRKAEMGEAVEMADIKVDTQTQIDIPVDAYLPSEYIYDSMQKIEVYKKVASLRSIEEENELRDELIDRFGDLPDAVDDLLLVTRLRMYGAQYGFTSIAQKRDEIWIQCITGHHERVDMRKVNGVLHGLTGAVKFQASTPMQIVLKWKGKKPSLIISDLIKMMEKYAGVFKSKGELQHVTQ